MPSKQQTIDFLLKLSSEVPEKDLKKFQAMSQAQIANKIIDLLLEDENQNVEEQFLPDGLQKFLETTKYRKKEAGFGAVVEDNKPAQEQENENFIMYLQSLPRSKKQVI
jgi:hypothetical protein